jgi:uncharacterized phage-associated protein
MNEPQYNAMTIAKWFVAWASSDEADLSNLKLQKLLYYAQGNWIAREGYPLFGDDLQAWAHGPVVPSVYRYFKDFKSSDLDLSDDDNFEWSSVDESTTQFLIEVWNTYGQFGAWRLRNMTHGEAPWIANFRGDESHVVIPKPDLLRHFLACA